MAKKKKRRFLRFKHILYLCGIVVILYLLYAFLNFEFRPFSPWRIASQKESQIILNPKKKKNSDPSEKTPTKEEEKSPAQVSQRTINLKIQGNLIVIEDVLVRKKDTLKYPPQYFTLEEFSETLEEDPRFQGAYFRLQLRGDEMMAIYEGLYSLLNAKFGGTDRQGRPYFKQIANF